MTLEQEINTVIKSKKSDSDMINVMEALDLDQSDFQHAFDLALEIDNRNLAKLLYTNYNARKVIVELTLLGRAVAIS